ncbi:cytochrome P450 [Bimuria novae-zelandiae CBS 107.79]|uniref:Cytochrome P450 n=1 Tax=Bimuria novae-zelandiae CBS 107.79 TaxID=1447943 RepID=A0A6A5VSH4_9PLEO|nr:cytochrome P450 [Bimuria novae-zelandiae CBS 107.79]
MSYSELLALAFFFAIFFPLLRQLSHLYTNYTLARQTGLRIIIVPFYPFGTPWLIIAPLCAPLFQHFEWCRILNATWAWQDGARQHERYGENFIVVSPAKNVIYTSDKVAIEEVLKERKVWLKPKLYETMDLYGRNVDTVNSEDWSRHRKITAPCFNERVSSFVWDETIRQTQAMVAHWLSQPGARVSRMVDDTRVLALHVLCAAGFGVRQNFHGGVRNPAPGHQLSHRDALMTVLNNLITILIITPQEAFVDKVAFLLPPRIKNCLLAFREFRQYTDEAIALERKLLSQAGGAQKANFISTLIRTSDQAKDEGFQSTAKLTDDEIKGNIFIFSFAGHDTTANTLAYAFALLSIHPEVQNWIGEEIDEVFRNDADPKYEDTHPQLKRVLAVMYETLRLYGPVPQIPRGPLSPNTPLTITKPNASISTSATGTTTMHVPPNTEIVLNLHAMHTTSHHYVSPQEWKPSRWITSSSSTRLEEEKLLPRPQNFAPWASGPRICPGMKFSQVEFTGVLSTVLRQAWVTPSTKDGSDAEEEARKTVQALVKDSALIGATVSMRRPGEVWLRVVRR